MFHKRLLVFCLALLMFTLGFAALTFAQEATPEATEVVTPRPSPGFTLEPEATLDPSLVFVSPLQENAVVNIRRGPGLTFGVRALLRPGRFLEAIGTNGFDVERPCSENLRNDLDMWIQVDFIDENAWVARCVVEATGDVSTLPVVVPPEATAEATTEAPAATPGS